MLSVTVMPLHHSDDGGQTHGGCYIPCSVDDHETFRRERNRLARLRAEVRPGEQIALPDGTADEIAAILTFEEAVRGASSLWRAGVREIARGAKKITALPPNPVLRVPPELDADKFPLTLDIAGRQFGMQPRIWTKPREYAVVQVYNVLLEAGVDGFARDTLAARIFVYGDPTTARKAHERARRGLRQVPVAESQAEVPGGVNRGKWRELAEHLAEPSTSARL